MGALEGGGEPSHKFQLNRSENGGDRDASKWRFWHFSKKWSKMAFRHFCIEGGQKRHFWGRTDFLRCLIVLFSRFWPRTCIFSTSATPLKKSCRFDLFLDFLAGYWPLLGQDGPPKSQKKLKKFYWQNRKTKTSFLEKNFFAQNFFPKFSKISTFGSRGCLVRPPKPKASNCCEKARSRPKSAE